MGIMKWGTPPSGDANDRKSHVVGHGDNVALVHAAFGDKVQGGAQINTLDENIQIATRWSTAPYKGPPVVELDVERPNPWGYRSPKREKRCMGNDDTCMAWATARYDGQFCIPHGRQSEGLAAWPPNEKRHADEAD
jgi:hypothetical protein